MSDENFQSPLLKYLSSHIEKWIEDSISNAVEGGMLGITWEGSEPDVQFWDAQDAAVKKVRLIELLSDELQDVIPASAWSDPLNYVPPEDARHGRRVRLMQALVSAYDAWAEDERNQAGGPQ